MSRLTDEQLLATYEESMNKTSLTSMNFTEDIAIALRAVADAAVAAAIPEGYAIVPIEPNPAIILGWIGK